METNNVMVLLLAAQCMTTCMAAILNRSFTDESALLAFKAQITSDPNKILAKWTKGTSFCDWDGITCSRRGQRVSALVLPDTRLIGTVPKEIGNLSFLVYFNISNNGFHGNIPDEIRHLRRLKCLNMGFNKLGGSIPLAIVNLTRLHSLSLENNHLTGSLPSAIGNLGALQNLSLRHNHLSGEIPQSIFNISTIERIDLSCNNLNGSLSSSITHWSSNLIYLGLRGNRLSGTIPSSISNASNLSILCLGNNFFSGHIPLTLGNLVHLRKLDLAGNQFTNDPSTPELGFLTSLSACRDLKSIDIGRNPLNGIFPKSLSNLSASIESFTACSCQIRGSIPSELGNFSNLYMLNLGNNDLTGSMPESLAKLRKMQMVKIDQNKITGSIPSSLCNLKYLYMLDISGNKFSGPLPNCLTNITSLQKVHLQSNALTSSIPPTLWRNKDILELDLSSNFFTGSLAPDIGSLKNIWLLNLSGNQFSGEIPRTILQLPNLKCLSLSMNRFHGPIPRSFSELVSLESLDLSQNNLSGLIPKSLERLENLNAFNVSFNRFSGEIPDGGPFLNFTADSFIGNDGLCGESRFNVRACKSEKSKASNRAIVLKYIVPPTLSVFVVTTFMMILLLRYRKRNTELPAQSGSLLCLGHKRISYCDILCATNEFDAGNLIGEGSLSMVYKGIFSDGMDAAVKVFNTGLPAAAKSFDVECQVFRSIRHRNLVKVITSCSNPEFKALVLEYLPKGSLDKWLYSQNYGLNMVQRLDIMIDVASALEYLHQGLFPPLVHCDLKPSNILLDEDMVAHVNDFGIAKLMMEDKLMAQTRTLGTLGYMAPEYGSAGIVSPMVDVYSFGIVLMETFTGRQPTDDIFIGELNMRRWISASFPDGIVEIADANFLNTNEGNKAASESCLIAIMELALQSTQELPGERINMKDVLVRLKKIKTKFQHDLTMGPESSIINHLIDVAEYGSAGIVSPMVDVYSFGIVLMETFTGRQPTDDIFIGELNMRRWISASFPDGIVEIADANFLNTNEGNKAASESCLIAIMELALQSTQELPGERINMKDVLVRLKKIKTKFQQDLTMEPESSVRYPLSQS